MIVLVGDIHGFYKVVADTAKKYPYAEIIQVGDFGFWPGLRERYTPPPRKIYFIDGNHDDIGALVGLSPFEWENPVEIWPNAMYVPRGTVMELDGKTILFMGGAKSIDRAWRRKNSGVNAWFEDEVIRPRDQLHAVLSANGKKIDLMVTHTPPQWMVDKYFGVPGAEWGLPADWSDISAKYVEDLWKAVDCPPLVCGHMHRAVEDGVCRILDINEVMVWDG